MDKEKEIEKMATVLPKLIVCDGGYGWDDEQEVDCWETARNLINAGYGNIGQAVREFVWLSEIKDTKRIVAIFKSAAADTLNGI